MKKCLNQAGLEPATYQTWNWRLRRHGYWGLMRKYVNIWLYELLSLCKKFGKAELYLIGSCQDEWLEATYYIYPWSWHFTNYVHISKGTAVFFQNWRFLANIRIARKFTGKFCTITYFQRFELIQLLIFIYELF